MVVLTIHNQNVTINYKTFILSKATLLIIMCQCLSIVLPFVFSYYSGGFWVKQLEVYEQPKIRFKKDYLVLITYNDNTQDPAVCISSHHSKSLNISDTCSIIKVIEIDENYDGKPEQFQITTQSNIPSHSSVASVHWFLPIDYRINQPCSCQIDTIIIAQGTTVPKTSKLTLLADLEIRQQQPLTCPKHGRQLYINNSIIPVMFDDNNFSFENLYRKHLQAKIKAGLSNIMITPAFDLNEELFITKLIVNFPMQKIYFESSFWQAAKFAWIQYFSIYLIISGIMYRIINYACINKLILLYERDE